MFRSLVDPTRRFVLDLLFEREGRTLTELEKEEEMTRIGAMKHRRIFEDAGLVVAERSARSKLYVLDPARHGADLPDLRQGQPMLMFRWLPGGVSGAT